jgi:hypothetical protein
MDWTNSGLGELLVMLMLMLIILIRGYLKDEIYFDTLFWEFRMKKSSTGEAAERSRNNSISKYNISWRDLHENKRDKITNIRN